MMELDILGITDKNERVSLKDLAVMVIEDSTKITIKDKEALRVSGKAMALDSQGNDYVITVSDQNGQLSSIVTILTKRVHLDELWGTNEVYDEVTGDNMNFAFDGSLTTVGSSTLLPSVTNEAWTATTVDETMKVELEFNETDSFVLTPTAPITLERKLTVAPDPDFM